MRRKRTSGIQKKFFGQPSKQWLQKAIYRRRPGVSLFFALTMIVFMILIAIAISTVVMISLRNSNGFNQASQAFYAAEGSLEAGLLANQSVAPGYSDAEPQPIAYKDGNCTFDMHNCKDSSLLHGSYQIFGHINQVAKYTDIDRYGIPTPGSGNAGIHCDTLNPNTVGHFFYPIDSAISYLAQDDPCNWNTIAPGDSVTIPLYTTAKDNDPSAQSCPEDPDYPGYKVCNPKDLGLTSLELRVRTPCADGSVLCGPIDRYLLMNTSNDPNAQYGGDDPVVSWEIDGGEYGNSNVVHTLEPLKNFIPFPPHWAVSSSVIYESKINTNINNGTFTVLTESKGGTDENLVVNSLLNFLKNLAPWNNQTLNKPVLKLKIIQNLLEKNTSEKIPYLEYQILTDTNLLPPDANESISAEGFSGSFKQVLQLRQPQGKDFLEYAVRD